MKVGKLFFHYSCVPVEDVPIAPVIPIRKSREIQNRYELEMLHDLAALLSMINDTPMVVIPWKK